MPPAPIRVFLVEDSPVALVILKRILSTAPGIEVVGTARNGHEALNLIPAAQPHVICTDLHMPGMDGLEFTREVMSQYPRPILVISSSVQPNDTENIFQLLKAGAVDVFPKPDAAQPADYELKKQDLISKIRVLSGVTVFTKHRQATPPPKLQSQQIPIFRGGSLVRAIAIGASTGGPQALQTILTQLPATLPVPVICVQHISEGFLGGLVKWLGSECPMPVRIAQAGEMPLPGTIYFAPEGYHLEFNTLGQFVYSSALPVDGHRPSVTALFKSASQWYGRALIGVLLTGMGRDGAAGLQDVVLAGGTTIVQDEASCVVFGMPKEAIALGAAQNIAPVGAIAPFLLKQLTPGGIPPRRP